MMIEDIVQESQEEDAAEFERLQKTHGWEKQEGTWRKEGRTAIYSDKVKLHVLKDHHDHPTAGHPEAATTYFSVRTNIGGPK